MFAEVLEEIANYLFEIIVSKKNQILENQNCKRK
jgi:hypothetical protein